MASDQHQFKMSANELSNPGNMEGSAEMASTSFSISQMTNSMPNQSDLTQNYQLNDLRLTSGEGMRFQQTNQSRFQQGHKGGVDETSSLQYSSGAGMHFQQTNQPQLSQSYQIQSGIYTSCGAVNFQQTSQLAYDQSQIDQSNSLPSTSCGARARHSQQFRLNQVVQSQADQLNNLLYTSGRVAYTQQTNQPQLSEACQSQNQLNSLQPTSGGVRNSQQSKLNRACQSQTDQFNSPKYTSGTVMQFQETRQPQLTQGEPSHDSPQTKSRSGNTHSDDRRLPTKSAIASKEYRQRQRNKWQDTLDENMLLKMKLQQFQQIHHQRFSAPAASYPRDHRGTNLREVDQKEISFEDIKKLRMTKESLTVVRDLLQESTSWPELLSEKARQSTIEWLHHPEFSARPTAADGFQTDHHEAEPRAIDQFINGSQINNDTQDSHKTVSSGTGGVVGSAHHTKNQENSLARTTPMAELSKKINTDYITKKGENASRDAKGGYNIHDWIKLVNKGKTSDGERQSQCSQGKGAQVSKLKVPSLEVVETSPKRRLDADASPSTNPALATQMTASKSITLSVELLETDSAFDNASVAHKISASLLPPADKKRMNAPSYVNARNSMHHAWLALAHAIKVEKQTKQTEHERNEYHKKTTTLDRDLKKAKLEARGFQLEVERLKRELAEAKVKENEAIRQANREYIARRAFKLCVNEVHHIYPNLDLSMISMDELKTVGDDEGSDDGNGEGDNTTNAKVIVVETDARNNDHDHHR